MSKEKRDKAIAEGLCDTCQSSSPSRKIIPGTLRCKYCTKKRKEIADASAPIVAETMKLERLFLKQAGICTRCRKEETKDNQSYCDDCLARQAERTKKYRDKKKMLGIGVHVPLSSLRD